MDERHQNYVRDIVYLLREKTVKMVRENAVSGSSELNEGRELALRQVLSTMQNQADVFGLDKGALYLDGFDALVGPVDPPKLRPLASAEEPLQ